MIFPFGIVLWWIPHYDAIGIQKSQGPHRTQTCISLLRVQTRPPPVEMKAPRKETGALPKILTGQNVRQRP